MGAWIEIAIYGSCQLITSIVAPLVGAWIEICVWLPFKVPAVSLPLWERGLKSGVQSAWSGRFVSLPLWERGLKYASAVYRQGKNVAPLVGAWIEIMRSQKMWYLLIVAPLVGAWIEMNFQQIVSITVFMSLPLWERGLKLITS